MNIAKVITATIVLLATIAGAFATEIHWTGYGPGVFGGYNTVSVRDGNTRYALMTTYDTINTGYSTCTQGRCSGAAVGMRRDTVSFGADGSRGYGDWYVSSVKTRYPEATSHIYRGTDGGYHGNVHVGRGSWQGWGPSYYAKSPYYPSYVTQPDYYGTSFY